jgi:hypothetical protein
MVVMAIMVVMGEAQMIIKKIVMIGLFLTLELKADEWDDRITPLTCGIIDALESGIRTTGQHVRPCCKKCKCQIPYSYCAGSACGLGCVAILLTGAAEIFTWPCRYFMVTSPSE